MLEPGTHFYVEVPYLAVEHPAITLWEHRQALARLKAQGRATADETAIFRMVTEMRGLAEHACCRQGGYVQQWGNGCRLEPKRPGHQVDELSCWAGFEFHVLSAVEI